MLKQIFILILSVVSLVAQADLKDTSDLLEVHKSGFYDCNSTKQVKLTVSEDGKTGVVPSICMYDVKCTPKAKKSSLRVRPFVSHCRLDGDNCQDFSDCLAEQEKELNDQSMSWLEGADDRKEPAAEHKDKFGHQCKYAWGMPLVIYRQVPNSEVWDTVCSSPITGCNLPESAKGSFLATCKAGKELKPGLMECPAPQSCLAGALPVQPAMTKSQAAALAASGARTQKDSATSSISNVTLVGASLSGAGSKPTHLTPNNK